MGDRIEPIRTARVARDKDQLAVSGACFAPRQMMLDFGGLAILVGTEETDVEIVPRILEIIGIAAKEGDTLLGSKHQTHIGVLLEAIQMVEAALVKCNHVAAQTGL